MILRLDIDAGRPLPSLERSVILLRRAGYRILWWSEERSPGGRGHHVELRVSPRPKTAMTVTALQTILGSDPYREACNVQRARMVDEKRVSRWWRSRWNVLYGRPRT